MASTEAERTTSAGEPPMRALVVTAPDEFAVEAVQRPLPGDFDVLCKVCLLYTSPSPRDRS